MGRETHAHGNQKYIPGDRWSECPRCSMDRLVSSMRWDSLSGIYVCSDCGPDEPGHRPVFITRLTSKPMLKSDDS